MAAQQKPKKVTGTRNSDRRNGKASKKNPGAKKPTGRTILGYKKSRFEAMAKAAGMTTEGYREVMTEERDRKKRARQANRAAFRNLIKGADKLYRDGTLKHGTTPVLGKHNGGSVNVGVAES